MNEQITTAAELDALPVGSVVLTERTIRGTIANGADPIERRVWQKFGGLPDWQFGHPSHAWQCTDGGYERTDCEPRLRGLWLYGSATCTVIYRPDLPSRTVVDDLVREAVKEYVWDGDGGWEAVLAAHDAEVRARALKDARAERGEA